MEHITVNDSDFYTCEACRALLEPRLKAATDRLVEDVRQLRQLEILTTKEPS